MAAKVTETALPSMVQFVMEEHWNFPEAAFSLAKTISAIKRFRKEAIMKLYDVPELPITQNFKRVRMGLNQSLTLYLNLEYVIF